MVEAEKRFIARKLGVNRLVMDALYHLVQAQNSLGQAQQIFRNPDRIAVIRDIEVLHRSTHKQLERGYKDDHSRFTFRLRTYLHYKGDEYAVFPMPSVNSALDNGTVETDAEILYFNVDNPEIIYRQPASRFFAMVEYEGKQIPRFTLVGEPDDRDSSD